MSGAVERKNSGGSEGVWGWNPHPGRRWSPARGGESSQEL